MTTPPSDPFGRALTDPAFLAAFTRCFRGDADPLDALRWLDDPAAIGLDGRRGPGAAERDARVALFRPDAGERQRVEHARLAERSTVLRAQTLMALEAVARQEVGAFGTRSASVGEEAHGAPVRARK